MKSKIIVGILLITAGIGLFVFYEQYLRPEKEARQLLREGKLIFERADVTAEKVSINSSINIFSKIIAKYPETTSIREAYFYIGKCYEKLKLYRLAYLRYSYLIKNSRDQLSGPIKKEIMMRLAHINILKRYSEEGVNQLYHLLNTSYDKGFRSRIYSELGHTYLKLGKYRKSKRMFDISLTEHGENEEALIGKARAYKRMGYDTEAYNHYEYFLKYYGAISQYTKDIRWAYRTQAYSSGIRAYRSGRYNAAISYFGRILKNFPYTKQSENALYWIGESHFAMKNMGKAISYFNRVLSNSYYNKDQDAQIKKGYAYFLTRKFDLAAREFQRYLRNYPRGKYSTIARKWKGMSTKELLYRIEGKKLPETEKDEDPEPDEKSNGEDDEEVFGDTNIDGSAQNDDLELENVAEL